MEQNFIVYKQELNSKWELRMKSENNILYSYYKFYVLPF